jgi:hypothetical protein
VITGHSYIHAGVSHTYLNTLPDKYPVLLLLAALAAFYWAWQGWHGKG